MWRGRPTVAWRASTWPTSARKRRFVHYPRRADPGVAFLLARLAEDLTGPATIGIFRDIERAVFGRAGPAVAAAASDEELTELLLGGATWRVARAAGPVTTAGAA